VARGPCNHDLEAARERAPKKFYALFEGARETAGKTEWLRHNVLPHLTGPELPASEIARGIKEFVGEYPEFYASYGAYDWVLMCQTFGGLLNLPQSWQWIYSETFPFNLPSVERVGPEHHALADAETLRKAYIQK